MTRENLLAIGRLHSHEASPEEIAGLVVAIRRNLADARVTAISNETRFDAEYKFDGMLDELGNPGGGQPGGGQLSGGMIDIAAIPDVRARGPVLAWVDATYPPNRAGLAARAPNTTAFRRISLRSCVTGRP